jgi:16S rRNA pseudouridine516 synthase
MRLDKLLAHATGLTRSLAARAIRAGEVRVDGQTLRDPSLHVESSARIEHGERLLQAPRARYFMVHKPAGYVCANRDSRHRTVFQLLDAPNPGALHVAGRLDADATGLVLVTDDGAWSHRVTSPRHRHPKRYRVTLATALSADAQHRIRAGIHLRGEARACAPADLMPLSETEWRITLTEGRYHQVKRMFAAVGNDVLALHREAIGEIVLDPQLDPGGARALRAEEIAAFDPGKAPG